MANKKKESRYPDYFPPYGPGWGRGPGYGPGWGRGRGPGFGRGYDSQCFRFPWLPRWWWSYPEYWREGWPPGLTEEEEKEMLAQELKALQEEVKMIERRLEELKAKKRKTKKK